MKVRGGGGFWKQAEKAGPYSFSVASVQQRSLGKMGLNRLFSFMCVKFVPKHFYEQCQTSCRALSGPSPWGRDTSEGKAPQRRPQKRLDRRLTEVVRAVGGGYRRLQTPLKLAPAVGGTVDGCRLCTLEGRGGGATPPPSNASPLGAYLEVVVIGETGSKGPPPRRGPAPSVGVGNSKRRV